MVLPIERRLDRARAADRSSASRDERAPVPAREADSLRSLSDSFEPASTRRLVVAPAAVPTDLRLSAAGPRLRDAEGRQVMLRGVNAGGRSKWAPYFPFPFAESGRADQKDAQRFDEACAAYLDGAAKLGHNFLRVPFVWEAVEPERGRFDNTYLTRLERMVDLAGARGMRVMLDAHQDLIGSAYGGDGFPPWALSRPTAKQPFYGKVLWGLGYQFDGNVRRDFSSFWRNDNGIQDAFSDMWRMMATRFATKTNVIGFEIFNEPAAGREPSTAWARDTLTEFHSRLGATIRGIAPRALVAFGVSGADGLQAKTETQRPQGAGWIFAPHYYDAPRVTLGLLGASRLAPLFGKFRPELAVRNWAAHGKAWQVPVVVGEFGIPRGAQGSAEYLRKTYEALDSHLLSGAAWEYSTSIDDWNHEGMSLMGPGGTLTSASAEAMRPYPAAIGGTLQHFSWDSESKRGAVSYAATTGQTSEIMMPTALVGSGHVTLRATGTAQLSWRYEGGRIEVHADRGGRAILYFSVK